jgi:hypothetical protein
MKARICDSAGDLHALREKHSIHRACFVPLVEDGLVASVSDPQLPAGLLSRRILGRFQLIHSPVKLHAFFAKTHVLAVGKLTQMWPETAKLNGSVTARSLHPWFLGGVADGTRTRNIQNHNLGLYH